MELIKLIFNGMFAITSFAFTLMITFHNYELILCAILLWRHRFGGVWLISESYLKKKVCSILKRSPHIVIKIQDPRLFDMAMKFGTKSLHTLLVTTILESGNKPMLWHTASGPWRHELARHHIKDADVAVHLIRSGIPITSTLDLMTQRPVVKDILNFNQKLFMSIVNQKKEVPVEVLKSQVASFLPATFVRC